MAGSAEVKQPPSISGITMSCSGPGAFRSPALHVDDWLAVYTPFFQTWALEKPPLKIAPWASKGNKSLGLLIAKAWLECIFRVRRSGKWWDFAFRSVWGFGRFLAQLASFCYNNVYQSTYSKSDRKFHDDSGRLCAYFFFFFAWRKVKPCVPRLCPPFVSLAQHKGQGGILHTNLSVYVLLPHSST